MTLIQRKKLSQFLVVYGTLIMYSFSELIKGIAHDLNNVALRISHYFIV
jgi:hypothetical protein